MLDFAPVYSYSRAQAIADGVLIDVTKQAKSVGFIVHTVVTDTLWGSIIHSDEATDKDLEVKITAFLKRCYAEATLAFIAHPIVKRAYFDYQDPDKPSMAPHHIIVAAGPGDSAETVLTIMFPSDD